MQIGKYKILKKKGRGQLTLQSLKAEKKGFFP